MNSLGKYVIRNEPTIISGLLATYYNLWRSKLALKRNARRTGSVLFDINELREQNHLPLFILGCGLSINALKDKEKDVIENSVSIGINLFSLSEITPSYYAVEKKTVQTEVDQERFDAFLKGVEIKRRTGRKSIKVLVNSPILLKKNAGDLARLMRIADDVRVYSEVTIGAWSSERLYRMYPFLFNSVTRRFMRSGLLYGRRGSVGRLCYLAVAAGFRDIVFSGVDLNNAKYFWDERAYLLGRVGLQNVRSGQNGEIHRTDDPNDGPSISDVLRTINNFCSHRGVRLWVTSENSKLAEFLPVYQFN